MEEYVVTKKLAVFFMLIFTNLIFGMDEELKISSIEIRGIKEVPVEVVENIMTLKKDEIFESEKMVDDYIKLKDKKYIDDLKIYPRIEKTGIRVLVDINENEEAKNFLKEEGIIPLSEQEKIDKSLIIRRIDIAGNDNVPFEDLERYIPLKVGGYFSKSRIIDGRDRLLKTGYFVSVEPDVSKRGSGIYVKYLVVENPKIMGIQIEGNNLFGDEELIELLRTKINNIYNINDLRKDKEAIEKKYTDAGYGLATVADMRLDEELNLVIRVSEGIVREIKFKKIVKRETGQRRDPSKIDLKTKDFVLEREVQLEKGKAFETRKFEATARNLFRLGYFRNVTQEIESIPGDPDGKVVVFMLDEQKTAQYNGTISYGSAIGLVGSLGVEDKNLRGKGQTLAFNFEFGENQRKTYEFSFNDPWIKGTERLSYGWSLYRKEYSENDEDDNNIEYTKEGFKISGGKGLTDTIRVKLGTRIENIKEEEEGVSVEDYTTVSLIPSISYDTRNNYYRATEGLYASFSTEIGKVLDEGNFVINELEIRKYHKGFFDKNTFAYRAILGAASDDLRDAQKFRAGGGNSLRGYDYGDFKGNYQLYINLENRTKLDENFDFVVFYDTGRAWDKSENSSEDVDLLSDIKSSYGVGLRVQTPLGPLRFDYGWPLNDSEKLGGQFYFNIGHLF